MKKTVLITGTSSGFGAAAARRFAAEGWNVVATMRDPRKSEALAGLEGLAIVQLDVESRDSIVRAVEQAIERFGRIDVLVNNAGYGLFGVFEGVSPEALRKQFDVNVFGAMDVTRALLPHFRANGAGAIVNVSSGAGAIGFPMASIYSASKFALEGWSEGLSYELASVGIRVKIVEPGGAMQTGFMARVGAEGAVAKVISDYLPFIERIGKVYGGMAGAADPDAVDKVVAAILDAATDTSGRLRYTPTNDIQPLLKARRSSSEDEYRVVTQSAFAAPGA